MISTHDEYYFDKMVADTYEVGNDPYNHQVLLDLFSNLWQFSRVNRTYVNDIDFREGFWDGPRRLIIEVDWYEADDWVSVENIPISQAKYGEWTAIVLRGLTTVAHTIGKPVRLIYIAEFSWLSLDRLQITYSER